MPHAIPPRIHSLLAYLIVNRSRRLTRASVASALWPDGLEEDARANLRRHLHRLNGELPKIDGPPWIVATTSDVQWNPDAPAWIDVAEYARRLEADDPAGAAAIYSGEFLEGYFDDWVIVERERLASSFLDVAFSLAVRARANRDFAGARDYADRILSMGEWREDALRLKMTALYEMDDRAGALATFDAFAKQVREEMSVDVMPETRALRETILANVPLKTEHSAARSVRSLHPIVGRTAELDRLMAAWQIAARRTGTTIFVGGEAGVGKTRLLAEFAQSVELQGGHALLGHARESEGAPYQPLVDVVRAAAPYLVREELPDVWLSALAPLVPELLRLHPDLPEIPNIEGGKQRLHEAFARVLESLAKRRPVAVILEDLHWANADTLDAFEHLARRAGSAHIVLVATYRPEEANSEHPLRSLRRHLQQERRADVLALGPLDRDAVAALVAHVAPDAAEPSVLTESIFRSSEGNSLFAWQLLQGFLETGSLSSENIAIHDAIAARAARLPAQTRQVLDIASLVGDRFTVEELAEIGTWDEGAVFAAVDALIDLRLLRYATAPGLDLSFAHRLIRDAIAAEFPAGGRAGLHRRIAAVLERTRDADAGLIASHHALAGDRAAAYEAYMHAARTAIAIFANGDAAERAQRAEELAANDRERYDALLLFLEANRLNGSAHSTERAVESIEQVAAGLGDGERFEARRRRCRYLDTLGDRRAHGTAAQVLLDLADATGRPEHRMHALHELGRLDLIQGGLQKSVALLEASLAAAPATERAVTVQCLALLAFALARRGNIDAAAQAIARGYAIVSGDPDPEIQSELLTADLAMALVLEDETAYREVGERYLELSTRIGSISGEALALTALGQSAHMRGEVAPARRYYSEARDLQEQHGLIQNFISNTINAGVLERELGNIDGALSLWERILPQAERLNSRSSIACCKINTGEALVERGDAALAIAPLEEALAICREMPEPRLECDASIALGCARARTGDRDGGVALILATIETRRDLKAARSLPNDYCCLVEELLDAGRLDEATAAASELHALYDAAPKKQMYPTRILGVLARAADARGARDEANHFQLQGKKLFDARMTALPDDATRATYAALSFNRAYAAPVRA